MDHHKHTYIADGHEDSWEKKSEHDTEDVIAQRIVSPDLVASFEEFRGIFPRELDKREEKWEKPKASYSLK